MFLDKCIDVIASNILHRCVQNLLKASRILLWSRSGLGLHHRILKPASCGQRMSLSIANSSISHVTVYGPAATWWAFVQLVWRTSASPLRRPLHAGSAAGGGVRAVLAPAPCSPHARSRYCSPWRSPPPQPRRRRTCGHAGSLSTTTHSSPSRYFPFLLTLCYTAGKSELHNKSHFLKYACMWNSDFMRVTFTRM